MMGGDPLTIGPRMELSLAAERTELLERDRELEQLHVALRGVGRQDGRTLVIEGAAGIGKSRLLDEARARAARLGVRVLTARATELEQGFPFGVIRQLFERLLVEADGAERARWLAGAAALAEDLLLAPPAAGTASSMSDPPLADAGYAWQHGLYWLASNLCSDSPMALMVDDLQWCDAPSARALAFIGRRLDGQPLALIVATRPLDPALTPEAAMLVGDPAVDVLRPSRLTPTAIGELVAARYSRDPDARFVDACLEVTDGNPFLVGELLSEAAARGLAPTAAAARELEVIVPRGVANAVLLRLARASPATAALARALSVLGDGAQIGDAARLAGVGGDELGAAMAELVFAGVVDRGGRVHFAHPLVSAAIYGDLSRPERDRLHRAAARILRERAAGAAPIAAQVMHTEPAADPEVVAVLREAAHAALALGDPVAAAGLLSRALEEPPTGSVRAAVLLELGQARARAGSPEAVEPLMSIVDRGEEPGAIASAANELGGMFLYAGRAAEGAAILHRAQERLPDDAPERERLQAALLGLSYVSASARRETDATIVALREPDPSARGMLPALTLATLAMDEVMYLRSARVAIELAERALAAGLPDVPQRGADWVIIALGVLMLTDRLDVAQQHADEILAAGRRHGEALTVALMSALRGSIEYLRGDLIAAEADAQAALELAPDLLGSEFVRLLAVPPAVAAGIERDQPPGSLRRLIDRTGALEDTEFLASPQVRYASGVLRAATGSHDHAIEELRSCALGHPTFGGENPAVVPWRSAAALSLAELGRHEEARELAADEVQRARSFGAPRAIGVALRAQALVGPPADRRDRLAEAVAVLAGSPARLEHARAMVDLGAALRAAGQRTAAREPLREALTVASRCGAPRLERRARAELAAIGARPRTTEHTGADSLTPSERRIVEFAAAGATNREIAQTLFVTEKTVETHLGHAYRKLDISSRRQLPALLARANT